MNTYTEEELKQVRERIAKYANDPDLKINVSDPPEMKLEKLSGLIYDHAKETAPDLAPGYLQCPPHLFYTDSEGCCIRRIYGMAMNEKKELVAHAVTALVMSNNDVVGGVPLTELVPVKSWSKDQLSRLNSGMIQEANAFLKPEGFMVFLPL